MKRPRRTPLIGVALAAICVCPSLAALTVSSSSTSTRSNSTSTSVQQGHVADYIANGIGLDSPSSTSTISSSTSSSSSSSTTSSSSSSSTSSLAKSSSAVSSTGPKLDILAVSSHGTSSTSSTSSSSTKQSSSSQSSKTNTSSTSLATTGSGFDYANACNKASVSWTSDWMRFPSSLCTDNPMLTKSPGNGIPSNHATTLCDGIPRMVGNFSTFPGTARRHCYPSTTLTNAPPEPKCSIQPSDCKNLHTSFSQAHAIPNNVNLVLHSYVTSTWSDYPRCVTNTDTCINSGTKVHNAGCAVYGGGIQLLYWPQTWASGFCGAHSSAVTMGPTIAGKPNTAVLDGKTFTSPTVYIKYDALSASNRCYDPIGPTLKSGYFPISSAEVSTKRPWFWTNIPWEGPSGLVHIARSVGINDALTKGWPGIDPDYADQIFPLDYPDLDDPVPAAPYFALRIKAMDFQCWSGGCPTMIPSENFPVLAIPSAVLSLAPEWASCTLPWGAMNDPPLALAAVTSIDGVSAPPGSGGSPSTSASPQNTITSTSGQMTSASATPCITPTVVTASATGSPSANTGGAVGDSLPSPAGTFPTGANSKPPPAGANQNPAPAGANQNPAPAGANQSPSPAGANQNPPPAGTNPSPSTVGSNPGAPGNAQSFSGPKASGSDPGAGYVYSPNQQGSGTAQTFAFSKGVANINAFGSTLTASMISVPGGSSVAVLGSNTLSNNGPAVTINTQAYSLVNGQIVATGSSNGAGANGSPQGSSPGGSNGQGSEAGGAVFAAGTSQSNSSTSSNLGPNGQAVTSEGASYQTSILRSALGMSVVGLGFLFL